MTSKTKNHLRPLPAVLAAAALFVSLSACQAGIDARVKNGPVADGGAQGDTIVRVFDIDSPVGLQVDRARSGLGLDLSIPQDAAAIPKFKFTVSLRPGGDDVPLHLTIESELAAIERPTTLKIPGSMLADATGAASAALTVKDSSGTRYVLAPEAIRWAGDEAIVSTSQPMGEWAFTSTPDGLLAAAANYLVIETTGLASDESLRYEVSFSDQALANQGFDIELPARKFRQKTTGNETRYLSAPAGTSGSYSIMLLEAPLKQECIVSSEKGSVRGRIQLAINCKVR